MSESLGSTPETPEEAFVAVYQGDRDREMYLVTPDRENTIGRDQACRIVLADALCSRRHGAFIWRDSAWWFHDSGSRNGTLVNDQRISQPWRLEEGDLILVGRTKLRFTREFGERSRSDTQVSGCLSTLSAGDQSSDDESSGYFRVRLLNSRSRVGLFTESKLESEGLLDPRLRRGFARLLGLVGPMVSATSVEELAILVLDGLLPAVFADVGAVLLFPEGTEDRTNPDHLATIARRSPPGSSAPRASRTVSRLVLREGEAILAMNIGHDRNKADLGTVGEMCSAICAPILGPAATLGLLHVYSSLSRPSLDFVSLEFVLGVANQMGKCVESLRQKESLQAGLQGEREISRSLRRLLETEGVLIGDGPKMRELRDKLARLASSDATVLVRGESGVGKELACRELHFRSNRRNGPFVCLNCAAIPESLLESELFGHEKGAFTGATSQAVGKFELAEGGTLFLDEVGELPLSLQARFLRVMEACV